MWRPLGASPKKALDSPAPKAASLPLALEPCSQSLTFSETWIAQRLIRESRSWLPVSGRGREVPHSKSNTGPKGSQETVGGGAVGGPARPGSAFFGKEPREQLAAVDRGAGTYKNILFDPT